MIPAHNEAALIARCLSRVLDGADPGEWEIVVVCNGCHDDTAEQARRFDSVTVLETEQAGKMHALDLGDAAVAAFPRIYLDADAVVSLEALRSLTAALSDQRRARVGSPALLVDAARSDRWVRAYFDVWTRLRYAQEAVGTGVYALTEAARGRFERFPERGADDALIYRLFTADERLVTQPGFVYNAPLKLPVLVRTRARMFAMNAELERGVELQRDDHVGWRAQGLERVVVEHPRKLPKVLLFVAIQIAIRLQARRLLGRDAIPWAQDRTTRS